MEPKYPNITIRPVDGNAFAIIGATTKALRNAGVEDIEIENYRNEATSGDYNNLLRTTMKYVNIETDEDFDDDLLCSEDEDDDYYDEDDLDDDDYDDDEEDDDNE